MLFKQIIKIFENRNNVVKFSNKSLTNLHGKFMNISRYPLLSSNVALADLINMVSYTYSIQSNQVPLNHRQSSKY